MELLLGLAEEADGTRRVHLGGQEFPGGPTVVGTNVKVGGIHADRYLAVVGVKVQQLVVCAQRNQWLLG